MSAPPHAREKAKKPSRPNSTTSLPTRIHVPKPVRFVTNNEEPQSKRRRISAACRTCQKRKIRCSGERPKCKTCVDSENECQGYVEQMGTNPKSSGGHHSRSGKLELSQNHNRVPVANANRKGAALDEIDGGREAERAQAHEKPDGTPLRCVPVFRHSANQDTSTSPAQAAVLGSDQRSKSSPVIPSYQRLGGEPVSPMIENLCESFFKHLGCNYPFLTRDRFMRDLSERKVDAVLVNAICALALRHPGGSSAKSTTHRTNYGQIFARRAMNALTGTFAGPNIAAVQASLLLAYEQFGSDSGLWVYLGLSIRMAQDLGMHKLHGLRFEGHLGPTPKTAKSGAAGLLQEQRRAEKYHAIRARTFGDPAQEEEIRRVEKERIDTFWAIFFLDRVVSSGTGRPVSLRDKDIEISFPIQDQSDPFQEWPDPFPALIRIVHLYGRVANLLYKICEANQVTHDVMQQLVAAEDDLIAIYTRLCPRLHFSAVNFQHYLKHSQATNFILLHFWFHTLIVLVHQPALLDSFEGRIQRLFPNSSELSLSSAKAVADILSFAQLLDNKSFILQALEKYWAGARYLVTVLDQKAKGSLDPLLYTAEEDLRSENPCAASLLPVTCESAAFGRTPLGEVHLASNQATGWSLNGSTDSVDSHMSLLYQTRDHLGSHDVTSAGSSQPNAQVSMAMSQGLSTQLGVKSPNNSGSPFALYSLNLGVVKDVTSDPPTPAFLSETPSSAGYGSTTSAPTVQDVSSGSLIQLGRRAVADSAAGPAAMAGQSPLIQTERSDSNTPIYPNSPYDDMIIESQDVDTSTLGMDPMLWLDYMPPTLLHRGHAAADVAPSGATSESAYDCGAQSGAQSVA